jgi:hypothetical protein
MFISAPDLEAATVSSTDSSGAMASKIKPTESFGDTQTVVLVSRTGSFQQVKF